MTRLGTRCRKLVEVEVIHYINSLSYMCIYLINFKWKPRFAYKFKIKKSFLSSRIGMNRIIVCLPLIIRYRMCVYNGGVKYKLVVARGITGSQRSGFRSRCGGLVWVLHCLTSLFFAMFMNWVSGDCYLYIHMYMYYRRAMQKCRSRRGRDRMVVGLTTICAISAYHL